MVSEGSNGRVSRQTDYKWQDNCDDKNDLNDDEDDDKVAISVKLFTHTEGTFLFVSQENN